MIQTVLLPNIFFMKYPFFLLLNYNVQEPYSMSTPTLNKQHLRTRSRWSTRTGDNYRGKHKQKRNKIIKEFLLRNSLKQSLTILTGRMTLSRSRVNEVVATYPRDDSFKASVLLCDAAISLFYPLYEINSKGRNTLILLDDFNFKKNAYLQDTQLVSVYS